VRFCQRDTTDFKPGRATELDWNRVDLAMEAGQELRLSDLVSEALANNREILAAQKS
jgi:hypothetical protein